MATKIVKKKPAKASISAPSKAAASAAKAPAKAEASAVKSIGSAVVPFSPMTAESFRKFTSSTPSFESPFGSAESLMSNYKEQIEKFTSEASNSTRQSVESYVKYSTTLAKGTEKILKTVADLAKESAERNAQSLKALMACRTINEFAEAQNKLAKENFDEAMSGATKISEMAIKVYNEASEPLNGQVTKVMKKMAESVAA